MAKLRRTLLIGLGGTGIGAILQAKKMFHDNYGEIPPMIGFLGIDTDRPALANTFVTAKDGTHITLDASEQLPICVDNPNAIYQQNQTNGLFDWMPTANVSGLTQLTIGAGQVRSNGRFAITVNEHSVANFVNNALAKVQDARIVDNSKYDLLGTDTEVHIVFSLGGGTGSGTFLNTAYLIKRLLPTAKISGYAVLSDVFRVMKPGAESARVRPNGKGALIDLDYLAHLDLKADPVEVKWFHQIDKVQERPFNALYLVDNRNDNNDMFNDVKPICQMVSLAIVTSVGELGVALASVSDNVTKLISDGAMDIKDKKAWVAGFGCAEIVFDGERLARIYARKAALQLISKMLNGGCDDPAIIANAWFDDNHIRENNGKDDVIDYFMAPNQLNIFQDLDDLSNPKPECEQFLNNRAVEAPASLTKKLDDLKTRIDASLAKLMTEQADRECGIFLCREILSNILIQIEQCDGEMKEEKEDLEAAQPRCRSAFDTACKELEECMETFLKRGKKDYAETVCSRTMDLARNLREIERRNMARQFYGWLRIRVGQSMNRVDIIINNLEAVRKNSNERIQHLLREGESTSFFQFDLAADVADSVACPLTDIVFNNFALMMKSEGGIAGIAAMSSQQTDEVIMRFVDTMPQVKAFRNKTIDQALDEMPENTFRDLISRAINKSLPLLPYNYRGFEADLKERPVESYYIGISSRETSRLTKGNLFQSLVAGARNVQFSEIGLGNRIIIYHQFGVVPAFTVKALDNYNNDYEKWEIDKPNGSHWDQKLCERMKRERYSLFPKNEKTESVIMASWVQAIIQDIISYNVDKKQYQIKSEGMGGRALQGFMVNMGGNRQEAYNYFADNFDVLGPEVDKALKEMDIPGPDNKMQQHQDAAVQACRDNTYLETISKCPISMADIMTYPAIADLIEKEMTTILKF
jgi:hypothetical protein